MTSVKKVLSVDLDYIMSPCISLYNNLTSYEPDLASLPDPEYWEILDQDFELNKFLTFSQKKLDQIKELWFHQLDKLPVQNIYIAKEHDSILTFLCQDFLKKSEVYEIYNIDHHHDIFYTDVDRELIERFNYTGCASWVWYLFYNQRLTQYFWIRNENSKKTFKTSEFSEADLIQIPNFQQYLQYSIEDLFDISFDYIFLCKSGRFFPWKFEDLWKELVSESSQRKNYQFMIDEVPYGGLKGVSRNPI